jgi:plastocyanin
MRARLLIIAAVALGLAGCSKSSPTEPAGPGTGNTSTTISIMSLDPGGSSASDYDANGKLVGGYGSTFSPPTLSVSPGTTVTWKNNDTVVHEPISDIPGLFDSRLDPSGTLNVQFATAGTYTYHCKIHPELTGTVSVK